MFKTVRRLFVAAALLAFGVSFALAQDATVKVRVSPPEAYIFVDGQPVAHRSQTITVTPGQHTIGVYNYGFKPQVETRQFEPGKNPEFVARLEALGGTDTGPWGKVMIEDAPNHKAAVYVNGIKPEFFVGHVDEFNHNAGPTQKLILPIGTYQLIIVNPGETNPVYSGQIEVKNNERVTVNVKNNTTKYEKWHSAGKKNARSRFNAGGPSTTVAVLPVAGTFSVDKNDVKCAEPVTLTWTSAEAAETTIAASPVVEVAPNGQRTDNPTHTTNYVFTAKGPGGIVTQTQTVHVDPTVQTALKADPIELKYRRIDDKVIVPANTTLAWSAENAQNAAIDPPLGNVAMTGQQMIAAEPKTTAIGPIDEMVTYIIAASNICGGSDKSLAAVHIVGTIEPLPIVPLTSVFFPTAWPTTKNPELGLFTSQNDLLKDTVAGFNKFLEYDPDARIKLIAHTDHRSSDDYNMKLSDRRADLVKAALIALGVDASKIDMVPEGETPQLDEAAVKQLEQAAGMNRKITDQMVHAYNRRVDLFLIPKVKPEQASKEVFPPRGAKEVKVLESNGFPGIGTVKKLSVPLTAPAAAGEQ